MQLTDAVPAAGVSVDAELVRADGSVTSLAEHPDGMRAELVLTARRGSTAHDVALTVRNDGPRPVTGSVRVRLAMPDVPEPWFLVPGAFYGANGPAGSVVRYPRFAVGVHDPAAMVSDHWELRADRTATPAVFAWGPRSGMALVTEHLSPVGMVGLGFAHDGATTRIHVGFPYREAPVSYDGSAVAREPDVATWTWEPGSVTTLRAEAHVLPADRHAYAPVLRAAYERSRGLPPVEPWVGLHEAAAVTAEGLHRWHYDPDPGVLLEAVGFDRGVTGQDGLPVDRQSMHVGWVSGVPWAFALLAHARRVAGTPEETAQTVAQERAARRVIDVVCAALSPSGTFWGTWYRGTGWTQSWSPVPGSLHAHTLGEATLFLLRALALGDGGAGWPAAARSNLDAVVRRQRPDGNLGSAHHAQTGEVLSWAGAAGLIWVAALAEAAALDGDGGYLAAAERAGECYARFVTDELVNGAPEDVDLAPTSEDGYAAVIAYLALHRRTGHPRWLELARRSADWMLTFRYTYDVVFAPRTLLGVYHFATRGADLASPANPHLHAYGLVCTAELLELSALVGDDHYRQRALETLACFRQLLPVRDGDVNAYRGMVTERYYQTDCFQPKGMVLTLSHAWSVGVLLLGCEQALAAGEA
ncbi:hypothetical protein [Georgenia sp. H159]|uniref:hypothetical protein n=1 Tax=Georgenia sp. H159 TaxID=3076115 RepID=UPI002D78F0D4|nr:hypothetical protein [Georgenia sp. H159]